jgi:membrane protease YdiL (CAAX protease family)
MNKMWANESWRPAMDLLLNKMAFWVVLDLVVPVLIYFLILKLRKENIAEFCRFKKMTKKDTFIVFLLTLGGIVFTSHLINISWFLKNLPEFDEYVKNSLKSGLFGSLFMIGLVMPACEEVLFRGMIFGEMRRRLPLLAVLLIHTLIYMPFQPTPTIAVYAYFNFTIYALIFIFTGSLWGSIMIQSLGAAGLYCTKLFKLDLMIRGFGDIYLVIMVFVSLFLIIYGTFSLRKASLKEIFSRKSSAANLSAGA